MRAKKSVWWDGGPVHFIEEVGIPLQIHSEATRKPKGYVQWPQEDTFQSVVIPNGLTANLHGPFEGKRHDSTMLQQTGTLNELRKVAFHNGHPFCLRKV